MSNFGSKSDTKRVALIGANKDALALLPLLFSDPATRLVMVVDPNPDAMLFKLMELGYRIASRHMVAVSTDLEELKKIKDLDAIINVLKDPATERFLGEKAFAGVEKLSPMSAKLLWNVRANTDKDSDKDSNEKVNKPKAINQATVLTPLRDIVDAVRLTHDRDELLTDILDIAIETTHAETGSVMLITKEDGKPILVMEVARGMDEEVIRKVRVPLGEGVAGKVARDGEPRIISGEAKDGDFPRALPRQRLRGARRKVKSAISVPLTVGVNIIGVINVNSSESNHVFIDEDLNLLTTLAGLAAEVIQKSSEHDRLKLDAAKFSLWKTLELNMSERKPLYKRLVMVCRHLAELVSGLTCFVYTYDDEKKKLTLNASSMKDSPAGGHLNFAYGEGIEGYLIGAMKEVILVDRSSDGAANKCVYMALPMAVKDDAVGVFVAQIVSPQGLSKYNESFLKEMTKLLGESIYTHRNNEADLARSHSIVKVDEMGLELIAMKDSKRLLSIIATAASEILGAEGVVLKLMEGMPDNFERVASHGLENKKNAEHFFAIEEETTREVLRKGEYVLREFSEDASPYVRGIISYPLFYSGELVGILSLFNKCDAESPYPKAFGSVDIETLKRFVVYVERVLPTITEKYIIKDGAVIATPELFRRRFEEEMKRAKRYGRELVIITVRVGGLGGVSGAVKEEFIKKLLGYINDKIRAFDVVTMLNEETVAVLFPETDARVLSALNKAILGEAPTEFSRGIFYGVASYPKDGDDFDHLIDEALGQVSPGGKDKVQA